jgi:anti-anti-sigma factor
MKITSFDIGDMVFHIDCGGVKGVKLLKRLVSLIMVAYDCSVESLVCTIPDNIDHLLKENTRHLIEVNSMIDAIYGEPDQGDDSEFGYVILGRDAGFIMLRDEENSNKYTIFLSALEENVNLASRCSYITASVLGFSSFDSFEVRFSVYELLMNIVEHGTGEGFDHWIRMDMERIKDKLLLSIVDKGIGFDPTVESVFDLENYVSSDKRRGLGLIMTRKITERMKYMRDSGFNRVFFEKSMYRKRDGNNNQREKGMKEFKVSDPEKMEDGSYLITLKGDLDTKGSLVMEDLMNDLLNRNMISIVLDFESVPFISSAGVGILIGMVSSFSEEGGSAKLINITPKVQSVLSLLNLDDFFDIRDEQALV